GVVGLSGLTISNGKGRDFSALYGGGVINEGSGKVNVTSCILSNNNSGTSSNGGAIGLTNGGTVSVANSTLSNNAAQGCGGGVVINSGAMTITNSTLSNNSANGSNGGAICSS